MDICCPLSLTIVVVTHFCVFITRISSRQSDVISLLKRWIYGTHQGKVSPKYLEYYLDEFAFRFNRKMSTYRGKLFYRLMQQAVTTTPLSNKDIKNT
jgi:hypothetical protein